MMRFSPRYLASAVVLFMICAGMMFYLNLWSESVTLVQAVAPDIADWRYNVLSPEPSTTLLKHRTDDVPLPHSHLDEGNADIEVEDEKSPLSNHSIEQRELPSPDHHEEDIEDFTSLSLNGNIDERGKWQRKQVELYCKKYSLEGVENQFPRDEFSRTQLFRHLIFDDRRQLLFAFIPKVGCTNMRRFLFVLQGVLPKETIHWSTVSEIKYLEPGIMRASFLTNRLTDQQRREMVATYYKFTIIRNPLERLVSAYRDKIEPPLDYNLNNWLREVTENIVGRYRRDELERWKASRGSFTIRISFEEYIQWIIDTPNNELNEHFAPIIDNIHPCSIKYDFYGNFKQLGLEVSKIIEKLQAPQEYFRNESYYQHGLETTNYVKQYYSQLSLELKHRLFHDFYQELDFYYHLYPEERRSHVELLEVKELIV